MKKKFTFDGYSFSLLKFNEYAAVYCASEGTRIAFYQIFNIRGGELILDRYNRYREFDRVKQEFKGMTKKFENKVITKT
jgi:hypothetical protein